MKKKFLTLATAALVTLPTFAGGFLTNTNQSARFVRNFAQGAMIASADGSYFNPAGTAFLKDGMYFSFSIQSAFQNRNIDSQFKMPANLGGKDFSKKYIGEASAPFIPSLFGVYKKGNWALTGYLSLMGGGGKASFNEGLPMLNNVIHAGMTLQNLGLMKAGKIKEPVAYTISSSVDGSQFIVGGQVGAAYKFNNWLSAFGGVRMNYFIGSYEGHVSVDSPLAAFKKDIKLNLSQTGWGLTPIIGVDVRLKQFNIGIKYEHRTNMNIENKTKENNTGIKAFDNGVNTPNDIPALLQIAGEYSPIEPLRISAEWHYYFDKNAGMANNKQKTLTHNTIEYLAGIEYDVTKRITLSTSYQNTNYGLSDKFQSDTSFSCDSYSIGLGGMVKITPSLNLNIGYFWTSYKDFSMNSKVAVPKTEFAFDSNTTYGRTNKVFSMGVEYKF